MFYPSCLTGTWKIKKEKEKSCQTVLIFTLNKHALHFQKAILVQFKCHSYKSVLNARTLLKKNPEVGVHLLTGLSASSSLRMDLPSISAGISIPAMSSRVGAKSMFNTM